MKKLVLSCVLALCPVASSATTLGPIELLQQFSLITTGDVRVDSLHVHGRALVGGELTGNLAEVNHRNIDTLVASDFDELIVGSATAGTQVRVLNQGSASFSGTPGYIDTDQNVPGLQSSPAVLPDGFDTTLSAFSDTLEGQAATAVATTTNNQISFDAASSGGTSVYDITEADLQNRNIGFNLNGADQILINVRASAQDTDFTLMSNATGNMSISTHVIWNFIGFDTLTLQRSIWGQVLADETDVYFTADIEGSLFADNVRGAAQIHVQTTQFEVPNADLTAVPLPAGGLLMLGGLAMLGGLRRRG